jgi:cobalamin biosynthetic protein CobC
MLEHGGGLRAASHRYGIALEDWIDLSTGIAPRPYPLPAIPPEAWQRLPENDDGLLEAAQAYYRTDRLMPLNGSQAAILALPRVFASRTVAVLAPSYSEYAPAWRAVGHQVCECAAGEILHSAADVIMLANPNNPDGTRFARQELLAAAERLWAGRRWLIVDEAFADADDEDSLVQLAGAGDAPNLIVLRSLGKFFGLAGARVGFCAARPEMFTRLERQLGPWPLGNPARFVAKLGLGDTAWQAAQKQKLRAASARLAERLAAHGLAPSGGTALFQYVRHADAAALHEFLARRGILVRCFTEPAALRFGLPATENDWARLARVLAEWGSK